MTLSYSSVVTSFIQCGLILILVQILLKFESHRFYVSPRFLYGMGLLFFVRLLLPVELGISITIPSSEILPGIFNFLKLVIFHTSNLTITIGSILFFICQIIVLYKLAILLKKYWGLLHYIHLKQNNKQETLLYGNTTFSYIKSSYVTSPAVYGFKKAIILLPKQMKFSDEELKYITLHELTHFRRGDIFLTFLLEIFISFYWWNPLVFLFKKQMLKIIELRVDDELLKQFTPNQCIGYAECLLKVKKEQHKKRKQTLAVPYFLNKNKSVFELRINKILHFNTRKVTSKIILILTLLLSFGSMLFIVEPYTTNTQIERTTFTIESDNSKNYLIKEPDGTFSLYLNNQFHGTIHDISSFPDRNKLPVYNKSN